MKKMTIFLSLMLLSSAVFAADCDQSVLKIAQLNLDSKAQSKRFRSIDNRYRSSDIYQNSLKKLSQDSKSGSAVYSLVGSINKTDYSIRIDVDRSCGIEMYLSTKFTLSNSLPCGLKGTVDERIKDCSYQSNPDKKKAFTLVSRSKDFHEVYKDTATGLLWSDRLPHMSQISAQTACNSNVKEVSGISDVTWRLASIEDFKKAEQNGIRKELPNMGYWYWSSTLNVDHPSFAEVFIGQDGSTKTYYRDNYYPFVIRCVGN